MITYIALLRGINVGGKNRIKMAELKELLENISFENVITYIQSGNIIFNSKKVNKETIQQNISKSIFDKYGYTINTLVISKKELTTIFESNPFIKKNNSVDISKLYATLFNSTPDLSETEYLENISNTDEFIIDNKTAYIYCPNSYGKTKLTNNIFEKKLKSPATSRNWKTITKLVELSNTIN
ncbi:Uncharacterized conserved protein, DUF1697 family [Lutibacter oricola]|uniref:Uncharacterized conserved protein, DUF1697 family n=1 Tax=Lutibacter oricola TaxID=762486 RepID=A0A1H3A4T7_9FLAO|nr:DUF1697 domain-containing protein [Lutibacter oricola]SDX24656.1 Uncharacterized conserved protein, DUF1697 family [Lutibacter oricola]